MPSRYLSSDTKERLKNVVDQVGVILKTPVARVTLCSSDGESQVAATDDSEELHSFVSPLRARTLAEGAVLFLGEEALNQLCERRPPISFYIGVPLSARGVAVGTLWCAGPEPRSFSDQELSTMEALGHWCERELEIQLENLGLHALLDRQESLGVFSHEVRNFLSGIISTLELSSDKQTLDREQFLAVQNAALALQELVDNTLDFTKAAQGDAELNVAPFRPSGLVESLSALQESQFQRDGIELTVEVDANRALYWGDKVKIRQILLNLLSNARKYTEKGKVDFRVVEERSGVRFSVKDTGIGMDPALMQRIFQPFVQAQSDAISGERGVGLGLSIVKNLVDALGGAIEVQSAEGKGSTFEVYLPLKPYRASEGESSPLESKRVLIVDDNPLNRRVMSLQLSSFGCEVDTASNGLECLKTQETVPADLILLDFRMPVMDGLETTKRLRQEPLRYGNPVIFGLTGGGSGLDFESCLRLGMNHCLLKPLSLNKLALLYSQCLEEMS